MAENLTAQQFADKLGVTRQLIYYHAKKLDPANKVYNEDNKLVFTEEQQAFIQSFMVDNQEEEAEQVEELEEEVELDSEVVEEEEAPRPMKPQSIFDPELIQAIDAVLSMEKQKQEEMVVEESQVTENKVTETEETGNPQTTEKSKPDLKNQATMDYIQQVVQSQLGQVSSAPSSSNQEDYEQLLKELEVKNQQISDLHRLIDQQQQLMLMAEQKQNSILEHMNNKLLKLANQSLEPEEVEAIKDGDYVDIDELSEKLQSHRPQANDSKKPWWKRIFL